MKSKTKNQRKTSRNRVPFSTKISFLVLAAFGCIYIYTTVFLPNSSAGLSVENEKLIAEIKEDTAAIQKLKTDIAGLEGKGHVLGMLEGQMQEDRSHVYYYE